MAYEVVMPKAGIAMEFGTIVRWLKKEGDEIAAGEPLMEIETDKLAMEIEAETSGTLLKIVRGDGEEVPVTIVVGYIGKPGEAVPTPDSIPPESGPAQRDEPQRAEFSGDTDRRTQEPGVPAHGHPVGKIPATPYAKLLAAQRGIDLRSVAASGSHGEVKARDIAPGSGHPRHTVETAGDGTATRTPLSSMGKTIARNMARSHASIPPVTLEAKADVTRLSQLRTDMSDNIDTKYSFNDFVMAAVARSLRVHPRMNSSLDGEDLVLYSEINLGMAVALPDGLIVPVVGGADRLSLAQMSEQARGLAERSRQRTIHETELSGATFTVTNLGMYGIVSFTPIINPPQAAILGVCAVEEEPAVSPEGVVRTRQVMRLCLTIDHRIIDGAQGALFLNAVKEFLEHPTRLLEAPTA